MCCSFLSRVARTDSYHISTITKETITPTSIILQGLSMNSNYFKAYAVFLLATITVNTSLTTQQPLSLLDLTAQRIVTLLNSSSTLSIQQNTLMLTLKTPRENSTTVTAITVKLPLDLFIPVARQYALFNKVILNDHLPPDHYLSPNEFQKIRQTQQKKEYFTLRLPYVNDDIFCDPQRVRLNWQ